MIAAAASCHLPGAASAVSAFITVPNFVASSGSPITPVEARKTCLGSQPAASPASLAELGRLTPGFAGEGVGVARN